MIDYNPNLPEPVPDPTEESIVLARNIIKDRIKYYIGKGILTPSGIIAKMYNADDMDMDTSSTTKLTALFLEAMNELNQEIKNTNVDSYFTAYLHGTLKRMETVGDLSDRPGIRIGDKLKAIDQQHRMHGDLLTFLERLGYDKKPLRSSPDPYENGDGSNENFDFRRDPRVIEMHEDEEKSLSLISQFEVDTPEPIANLNSSD